jgi:hypothetical protein
MDAEDTEQARGGDPACWAHLVCAECGAVETEGHREGCRFEHPGGLGSGPTAQD